MFDLDVPLTGLPVPLEANAETTVDHLSILQLIGSYSHLVDDFSPIEWGNLFTEDALFEIRFGRGDASPMTRFEGRQAILDVMLENGALTCGRSATGLGLYGLVKGSSATVALRHALRDHVGHYGGTTIATITDNHGARVAIKE